MTALRSQVQFLHRLFLDPVHGKSYNPSALIWTLFWNYISHQGRPPHCGAGEMTGKSGQAKAAQGAKLEAEEGCVSLCTAGYVCAGVRLHRLLEPRVAGRSGICGGGATPSVEFNWPCWDYSQDRNRQMIGSGLFSPESQLLDISSTTLNRLHLTFFEALWISIYLFIIKKIC